MITPGPWYTHPHGTVGKDLFVVSDHGHHHAICELAGPYETKRSNGRLIAAAPDLLEALSDLADYMTARSEWELSGDDDSHAAYAAGVINRARDAISRARGDNPKPWINQHRKWGAAEWARAKEDQRRGAEFLATLKGETS